MGSGAVGELHTRRVDRGSNGECLGRSCLDSGRGGGRVKKPPSLANIRAPCNIISATRTSITPSDTPSFHQTGSATSGEISVDWRPSPAPQVGTGTVWRISNELGCACGRCDPPVGGLLNSENCL